MTTIVTHPGEEHGYQTVAERRQYGRAIRRTTPRSAQAGWSRPAERSDPVAILEQQGVGRIREFLPIRYERMAASPFAFLRGAAAVMASDLATGPTSGLRVQLSGDAHLANFGFYGSPERTLLFDLNDFDETLPGPWEWDVKRVAASFVVAGRANGYPTAVNRGLALNLVGAYRQRMADFAGMRDLDVWYTHLRVDDLLAGIKRQQIRARATKMVAKAEAKDSLSALGKLTTTGADGRLRIIDNPPLIMRVPGLEDAVAESLAIYRETLPDNYRHLLAQYRLVDAAHKIVGVGSVGTRCLIALLLGRDDNDPLLLQVKQAQASVLEPYAGASRYPNAGQRVVAGQRLLQAGSDIFLGWIRARDGNDYYWRQLWDMKGSVPIEGALPEGAREYARLCGTTLARAHARSGDRIAISAYLGSGPVFDEAVADFAESYADQSERDHAALVAALADGRLPRPGAEPLLVAPT